MQQGGVLSARPEGDAPLAVGSRAVVTRRVGPRELPRTEEIAELNPRAWAVHGIGGKLTAIAKGTIEPLDRGDRSRITIAIEFEGHEGFVDGADDALRAISAEFDSSS
jgi:hypothetical protein